MVMFTRALVCAISLLLAFSVKAQQAPSVLLANVYEAEKVNVSDYLVSEKYDGVRAIWTGKQLITRTVTLLMLQPGLLRHCLIYGWMVNFGPSIKILPRSVVLCERSNLLIANGRPLAIKFSTCQMPSYHLVNAMKTIHA